MTEKNDLYKDIVIIYHDRCRDGFGAAYSAWKRFGDKASYVPRRNQDPVPPGLIDKEIYILDYSYPLNILDELERKNRKVLVIDHHHSASELKKTNKHIFDTNHSGAVLAWKYFHPDKTVPRLLLYVEDHDLWKFELPHTHSFGAALGQYEPNFIVWDQLVTSLEQRLHFNKFITHGEIIYQFEQNLIEDILSFREPVLFEGHEVCALNASRVYRSILGNRLAEMSENEGKAPMGIVYYRYSGAVNCSLRSRGDFDVCEIAIKHGGGGHKRSASFSVSDFSNLPFTFIA